MSASREEVELVALELKLWTDANKLARAAYYDQIRVQMRLPKHRDRRDRYKKKAA